MKVICVNKGMANFTYGEVYEAIPRAAEGLYVIIDDNDKDTLTVLKRAFNKPYFLTIEEYRDQQIDKIL